MPTSASETLAQRRIVQAVVQGLLVNDSAEAWDTLQAVLSHQQQTPLDLKQASIVVFEEVFGSEQINVAMAEKLAVFVLNSPDQMQVGMNLLTSLASQISRMNLHLTGVSQTPPAVLKPTPATGQLQYHSGSGVGTLSVTETAIGETGFTKIRRIPFLSSGNRTTSEAFSAMARHSPTRNRLEHVDLGSEPQRAPGIHKNYV